jgi:hypothetical protein
MKRIARNEEKSTEDRRTTAHDIPVSAAVAVNWFAKCGDPELHRSSMVPHRFCEEHWQGLVRDRGIHAKAAEAAHLETVYDARKVAKDLGRSPKPLEGLGPFVRIPFRAPGRNHPVFHRYRLTTPLVTAKNGKEEEAKYLQPSGLGNHLYFPPLTLESAARRADPDVPVLIVEGEFKALAAETYLGEAFVVVGVTGVWNWLQKENGRLVPEFHELELTDRSAYIAFDSDRTGNDGIRKGERRLAQALWHVGAVPYRVELPDEPFGQKMGVDDFLVSRKDPARPLTPTEPLIAVLRAAQPFEFNADEMLPIVHCSAHEYHSNEQAAQLLSSERLGVYSRADELVQVVQDADGIRIAKMAKPVVRNVLTRAAQFRTVDGRNGKEKEVGPPKDLVDYVYTCRRWENVEGLDGVVDYPVLRPDGSILSQEGYDRATRLYVGASGPVELPDDEPTQDDARQAAEALCDLVADFPFEDPVHCAAWVAGVLTIFARPAINGPVPMVLVDANRRGSGKTKLADAAALLATGRPAPMRIWPSNDEERAKSLLGIALAGSRLVVYDNVSGTFGRSALEMAITTGEIHQRILKESRDVKAILRPAWWATGNNVEPTPDMSTRCLHVRLRTPLERPEERKGFRFDPFEGHVLERRPALVRAALTILRAHVVAGRPRFEGGGRFGAWDRVVRDAVMFAGLPDPVETTQALVKEADGADPLEAVFLAWSELDPDGSGLTSREILKRLKADPNGDAAAVFCDLCNVPGVDRLTTRGIGAQLKKSKDRVVGGRVLASRSAGGNALRWLVAVTNPLTHPPEGRDSPCKGLESLSLPGGGESREASTPFRKPETRNHQTHIPRSPEGEIESLTHLTHPQNGDHRAAGLPGVWQEVFGWTHPWAGPDAEACERIEALVPADGLVDAVQRFKGLTTTNGVRATPSGLLDTLEAQA